MKKRLKQAILDLINSIQLRKAIADILNVDTQVIALHIRQNRANGRMIKLDFLEAVSSVTGVPVEDLTEDVEPEKVQN